MARKTKRNECKLFEHDGIRAGCTVICRDNRSGDDTIYFRLSVGNKYRVHSVHDYGFGQVDVNIIMEDGEVTYYPASCFKLA